MKGYKAVNQDGSAMHGDMVYEVGGEYSHDGELAVCGSGLHFCENLVDVFHYYPFDSRVFEVEATGCIATDGDKSCTDRLKVLRELPRSEVLEEANTGCGNAGVMNSGNWNSGNRNSGNWNSGNRNSGNWNSGNRNSGYCNSGYWNSGNWNSGDRNSGYYNKTNYSSGVLCTEEPECLIFDQPSGMTLREWVESDAAEIMSRIMLDADTWIPTDCMTDDEKAEHPKWETCGGYLRKGSYEPDFEGWWSGLDERERGIIFAIPNFDAAKWRYITGLDVADAFEKWRTR